MAEIAPFRGYRYDLARVGDGAAVIAPPYDVIGETERAALEAGHPKNVVHVDLPRGEGDARYQRAADLLRGWIAEGTLRRDDRPALYRYRQTFRWPPAAGGRSRVRSGFIGLLRLSPFSERVVLPHEKTLSGPKADRLKLMRATRAHTSQIFVLHRDPRGEVEEALSAAERAPAAFDATTPDGVRHELWTLTDPAAIGRVKDVLAPRQVMIADGHHRYETMISLRDELRPAGVPPGRSAADWGAVFFARVEDPGLLVLPTHRLVRNLPSFSPATLAERARPWFDVALGDEASPEALEAGLGRRSGSQVTFAVRSAGSVRTLWLVLRADADLSSLGPPALRRLCVTVLHGLLLGPVLGIAEEALAKQSYLGYTHDTADALARIASGEAQAAFLMNATRMDDVLTACESGFVLPQKSTYFQPKLATGLVTYLVDPSAAPGDA